MMNTRSKRADARKKRKTNNRKQQVDEPRQTPIADKCWRELALIAATEIDPAKACRSALAVLGRNYGADRSWMGYYNAELTHFWGQADWVGPGIRSHLVEIQGASIEMLGEAHQIFLRGENVAIPDVEMLPRQARSVKAELRREQIKATLCAPYFHDEKLIGFYGFDYVHQTTTWTPAEVQLLKPVGQYLVGLLLRARAFSNSSEPAASEETSRAVYIREKKGMSAITADEIAFIKVEGDYSRLHFADGRKSFLELRSLRSWQGQLPSDRFMRVHHSYIVNCKHVAQLDRSAQWTLRLQKLPHSIPVSRTYRHQVRLRLGF